MSLSIDSENIKVYRYTDPMLELESKPIYTVLNGAQNMNQRKITTQQVSNSQITWNYFPPAERIVVGRRIIQNFGVRFSFTGSGVGPLIQLGSNDAPRAAFYGVETAQLKIDNGSVSWDENNVMWPFHRYLNPKQRKEDLSFAFIMPDAYAQYQDYLAYGSSRNALSFVGESSGYDEGRSGADASLLQPVGAVSQINIISNTNTSAVVDVLFSMPLWISPMEYRNVHNKGLIGIQQLQYTINFTNDLSLLWSHSSAGNTISSITASTVTQATYGNPFLLVEEYNLQPNMQIPKILHYNYYDVQDFITQTSVSVAPKTSLTNITSNNITLGQTPQSIYVYARQQKQDWTIETTNTAAVIKRISVNWDTRNAILAEANTLQLFNIAAKNGYAGSYNDFSLYSGSIVKLNFGDDIPLDPLDSPGVLRQHQLSITMDIYNQHSDDSIVYEMIIVVVNNGIMTKTFGNTQFQTGVVTSLDVIASKSIDEISAEEMQIANPDGGDFLGKLRNIYEKAKPYAQKAYAFGKKAHSVYKQVEPHLKTAVEVGKAVAPILASLLAAGYSEDEAREHLCGMGYSVKDVDDAERIYGGRLMGQKRMKKRLRNY